jgi:hypothetical protein
LEKHIDSLMETTWRLLRTDGSVIAPVMRLLPWKAIGGHVSDSMRGWDMRNNRLVFLDANDVASIAFTLVEYDAHGPLRIVGSSPANPGATFVLERSKMPSGIDLGQQSAQTRPVFLKEPQANAPRGRNLVVLRANEESLHTQWPRNIPREDRNWDLCISWYGKSAPPDLECEYLTHQAVDRKFGAIHALFLDDSPLCAYDNFWLPDDDVMTSWADINRMFRIFQQHDLLLAQPSLEANGNVTHRITLHRPGFALHYSHFVEVMCPLFSAAAFKVCLPSLNAAISGWGLDVIWPSLLGGVTAKIAVIDDVIVQHTRPVGQLYDNTQARNEMNALCTRYGCHTRFNFSDCGGLLKTAAMA